MQHRLPLLDLRYITYLHNTVKAQKSRKNERTAFKHHWTRLRVERIFVQLHRTRKRRRHPKHRQTKQFEYHFRIINVYVTVLLKLHQID